MIKTGNVALDTFVELKEVDWIGLYEEYIKSYNIIHTIANKIRKEYKNTKEPEKLNERKIVYDMEKEILENIMSVEEYLPYDKRYFLHKQKDEIRKMTFNKSSDCGFTPIEKMKYKEIENVVHNKILQSELINILKELLTDKQYACTFLYYYEGYTQEQIADKLKIDSTTVCKYIQNSLEKIRKSEYFLNILKETTKFYS